MQTEETQSWVLRLSRDEAKDCLAHLLGLAGQLDGAMDAIVRRNLPRLRDSVHLQEASCGRLTALRHGSRRGAALIPDAETPEAASALIDSELVAEIRSATESLLLLSERYAALLKHSGETLRLLSGLYWNYCAFAPSGSGAQANLQASLKTWSCEV